MDCPKCKQLNLESVKLNDTLPAYQCSRCQGQWINGDRYKLWQTSQGRVSQRVKWLSLSTSVALSPFDIKAGFCPECNHYLTRGKVSSEPPFYVERCPQCKGYWCDEGEWELLNQLNLHHQLHRLFSSEWQSQVREQQHQKQEQQALIEKIGEDLSLQIFALAEVLEEHPHGDFAVAYLMRRVGESDSVKSG